MLRRWVDDATRGASDLGTDGIDLVWSEGEGKLPSEMDYPTKHIMTAPFTTDPSALQPKRLRSQPRKVGARQFKVGCGYAMNDGVAPTGILITRISDGWSWAIQGDSNLKPSLPIGLTCEHAYVVGLNAGVVAIFRIALNSLGPGIPPD